MKVDLIRGYHQIPVHPDDVRKTAIIMQFGLIEFLRMPFGLKNAAQSFQCLMDMVCAGLDFVFVYLDDILIASESATEYKEHLRVLFDCLEEHGLVEERKMPFWSIRNYFLGHRVDSKGIRPLPTKVKAIAEFPTPSSITELERFIGMVNFYHIFVPKAAEMMKLLYQALTGKPRPKTLTWSQEMDRVFQAAKDALSKATLLQHPVSGVRTALTTDASDTAISAVLEQQIGDHWQPLAFYS